MQELSQPSGLSQLRVRHYAIIGLAVAAAAIHFAAALDRALFPDGPDPLFILNGLGYLGLLGAYFLPIRFFQARHRLVWWALVVYVIATIIAWLAIWVGINVIGNGVPFFSRDSLYGVPAKLIELALLYMLWRDKP